ncbi:alpha-amylase [Sphingobium yanoikuyae]|uniref:alpha-amylase n=1 Tax=Sphingobium yanoikuyae TaxID=13690 RepID=UPI0022DDBFA2|nr:alpha-amylase [Sphingobium yanoikuyae]WBQ19167.1 alpha-amylase [Sphingobium yanoikuyae]
MAQRTLLQFFHWYYPTGGGLWDDVAQEAQRLADLGISDVWLPPAYKGASGGLSVGYDSYDLFDLGEFDQKGSIATKYGDREALERATTALRNVGLRVIHDVVFNHKIGADETEPVSVRRANPDDRRQLDDQIINAKAWTRFSFPGRGGQYSRFVWDARCFTGIDHIEEPEEDGVFRIVNEYGEGEWHDEVDDELGNYDYLMGADVEFRNHAVYEELKFWGQWLADQVACDGFRLDAAKHIPAWFFRDWVGHMRETIKQDLFVVAEYWHPDKASLQRYLDQVDKQLMLFDVALCHRFHDASVAGDGFDLRTLFDETLVAHSPGHAVTLVGNHDTQPLQALEAPVADWFKPLAYALILIREQGIPCIFHPDLYGASYVDNGGDGNEHHIEMAPVACLPRLIEARRRFAHGSQTDLFDDPHCIAVVRHGTNDHPGVILVLSNGITFEKRVSLGREHAGAAFRDFLGHIEGEVFADEEGNVEVASHAGSVSLWVRSDCL